MNDVLRQWVIYATPLDYPAGYMVRRWSIGPNGAEPSGGAICVDTLELARKYIPPGLYRIPRFPDDDVSIVEVWT